MRDLPLGFYVFVLLCLFSSSYAQVSPLPTTCPAYYVWQGGCIKTCQHPDMLNCPIDLSLVPRSDVCAYYGSGNWATQNSSCHACRNSAVVGFKEGPCTCLELGCPFGQSCIAGVCYQSNAGSCPCAPGYQCVNGYCVPQYPSQSCAAVQCPTGYDCVNGNCVLPGEVCSFDSDCGPYESCVANRCQDKCLRISCRPGYKCINGNCVDLCFDVICTADSTCINGTCVPLTRPCSTTNDCGFEEFCNGGICIDACRVILCQPGLVCQNGQCVPSGCPCPPGFNCANGNCVPIVTCATILCERGY